MCVIGVLNLTVAFTLFLVLDPFGNVPVFMTLLKDVSPGRRRVVILREHLIALGVLLVFLFFGPMIMKMIGADQAAVNVAGGVVIFIIAMRLIFPSGEGVFGEEETDGEPLIVPLAIPLLAGPSTIATVMLMSQRAGSVVESVVALVLSWSASLAVLLLGVPISRLLGKRVMKAVERLMGMILTIIAVGMMMSGVKMMMSAGGGTVGVSTW